jgi:hypothetical protein
MTAKLRPTRKPAIAARALTPFTNSSNLAANLYAAPLTRQISSPWRPR